MRSPELTPDAVIQLVWLVWIVSWFAAALWSARPVARAKNQAGYRAVIVAGAAMLFAPHRLRRAIEIRLWHPAAAVQWTLVVVCACGFLITWWARVHLGALWSGQVTRKAHHRIVDTGPYGSVRHPIYTGLIVATIPTAALQGTVAAAAGAAVLIAGYYLKARVEEQFLREQLGAADYDAYARRVPMLIPFCRL